jgi:hypothetical protein
MELRDCRLCKYLRQSSIDTNHGETLTVFWCQAIYCVLDPRFDFACTKFEADNGGKAGSTTPGEVP